MKRRHFISFVFVLILYIGMIGCGKEKKTTASDKFQSDYMEIGVGTTVEKGYFGVINGLLYYVDFETMNAVPICNKPDCRHISWMEDRNTKCNAANTDIWNLFPYKGKLYGFRSLADGGSELVVSDLDGSNWKSKGMFIKAEESFHEGVVVKDQMFLSERCGVKRGRGGRTGVGNGNVYVGFRYNEVKRDLQRTRHFFYSISRRNERLSDLFSKRGGWGYLLSV